MTQSQSLAHRREKSEGLNAYKEAIFIKANIEILFTEVWIYDSFFGERRINRGLSAGEMKFLDLCSG